MGTTALIRTTGRRGDLVAALARHLHRLWGRHRTRRALLALDAAALADIGVTRTALPHETHLGVPGERLRPARRGTASFGAEVDPL